MAGGTGPIDLLISPDGGAAGSIFARKYNREYRSLSLLPGSAIELRWSIPHGLREDGPVGPSDDGRFRRLIALFAERTARAEANPIATWSLDGAGETLVTAARSRGLKAGAIQSRHRGHYRMGRIPGKHISCATTEG
jgi:hypothetical protein